MSLRRVTIMAASGLHARPASLFTQAAGGCGVDVLVGREGGPAVDASSILMVMSLGIGHGDEVLLTSEDPGADAALDRLAAMLATDLDAL